MKEQSIGKAESIESNYRVNHVDSGLPHWLIEVAFVCLLLQGVCTWTPLMHWMEGHLPMVLAVIQTFGAVVMYYGLLRGMKPLYRPCTIGWWLVIALNIAGFFTTAFPVIPWEVGLAIALSLMVVYVPMGVLIAVSYRGRLRQVGIWMALYILISSIIPVMWFLIGAPDSGIVNNVMEFSTISVVIVYAWVLRRVLVK
ncbi:MAG: hypothetical protein IJR69_10550 [Bacteroidaceae bacterium]|jgi:hypothetical protein|nr:hypothetical protein [Bacteroidaceae bacterium]